MKAKFLKKEIILLILSLLLSNMLIGCSGNSPAADSSNEKKEISKNSSKEVSVNPADKPVKDESSKNNVPPKTAEVIGKVKLYEGIYFDDKCYGDDVLKPYCEVAISNVTDTSFDFTVYQVVDVVKKEKKVIFLKNTAVFTGDGTKAAFYGKDYTLHFTFPNNHNAYPVVTDMEISGFKPLEGKTFVNNGIPGHEFG